MKYTRVPGVEDIYPDRIDLWNHIIETAKATAREYNFRQIITPIFEYTELFKRGIGDETDIVSKEMYTFEDRGGRNLTLRPEGTAAVVRAYCENGDYNRLSSCKLFYIGPMFRAERHQKGRYKQFNQFGIEFFGEDNPYYDFESISLMNTICKKLNICDYKILLNSIGCSKCRPEYINQLKKYYTNQKDKLCNDCQKRLDKNPLRLLDCKNENCIKLKNDAPKITNYICEDCKDHHETLKGYLDNSDVKYTEDAFLVRGLDYYCKTTFEFVTDKLGGQNAFSAGGRYNTLVENLGGSPTPAIGFAAGLERIYLMIESSMQKFKGIDAYIIHSGESTFEKAVEIANFLRKLGFSIDLEPGKKGFKSQFKKADREKSKYVIIIGEDELSKESCSVKDLESGKQELVSLNSLETFLNHIK